LKGENMKGLDKLNIRPASQPNPDMLRFGLEGLNAIISSSGMIPQGRVIQIIAPEKHGKTTLALDFIAANQDVLPAVEIAGQNYKVAWVDLEHQFSETYARTLGVDPSAIAIIEEPYGEDSFETVETLLEAGITLIVVDSIPMFQAKSEEDKTLTETEKVAAQAGPVTRIMRRMVHLLASYKATMILINQMRANISTFSRKESKPAGAKIIQYISSLTIELVRTKNGDTSTETSAVVTKNKFGAEGGRVNITINYGRGPDYHKHWIELAEIKNIIQKRGAWYYYTLSNGEEAKAHGIDNTGNFPMEEIKEKVRSALYGNRSSTSETQRLVG
jgi:recombination protein RecA